ncbi:cobyrinic acid a,c-diamide synthase [Fervidicella metallireducens AeB]|uniref:Cobyrinic acid a,c-diamide synthase n=1 Tax=Fervidicella metallireducens AeB TaxID=1403537 RepID=A0A017RWR9_9CLOT|nr:cobyrinate a,c-diamide synthase [Fervidicella metallireducens]EYE89223.1 cobyrinic acid a,c-diamide synthase [Fervidicella metallireducens AeB]
MKTIMITAPSSGSGKTTITIGIIRALKNMGLDVCAYKTGPDYIDTAFLSKAAGKRAGNLDMHLQGKEGMFKAMSFEKSEYCIVEGAMGYFDGIYNTCTNSSYDISRTLGINSVLIYTPYGEMFSAVPKIKGMAEFEDSNIKAVIFNNVNLHYYQMLKEAVEKHTDIKVLGYIPKLQDMELKSRHLGLIQSVEIENLEEMIDRLSEVIRENIDINGILSLMNDISTKEKPIYRKRKIRVAVAMDKAFSFYYKENLVLLENMCDVVYFSPMKDEKLPDCDLVYLGGGYPEVFKDEISKNKSMIKSIMDYADNGGFIYAECGGFMYLTEHIDGTPMVGIFKGNSRMTKSLQRFGYIDIELKKDSILGAAGEKLTAHEFHKSTSDVEGECIYKINRTMGEKTWECGYTYKNVLAGYPHINFIGNTTVLEHLLDEIEKCK